MSNPNIQTSIVNLREAARRARWIATGCTGLVLGNATSIATGIIYNGGNRFTILGTGVAGGAAIFEALKSNDLSNRATTYEAAMLAADPEGEVARNIPTEYPSIWEETNRGQGAPSMENPPAP